MSADVHGRARELIVSGTSSPEEQRWLDQHLAECRECGGLLQRALAVRTALRTTPVLADANLVEATKRRVLRFAAEQKELESHRFLVRLTIALAAVLAWASVPLLWQAAQWLGRQTSAPELTAVLVFMLAGILPAVLAAATALAARSGSATTHQQSSLHFKGDL